jgi:hypothetical protein
LPEARIVGPEHHDARAELLNRRRPFISGAHDVADGQVRRGLDVEQLHRHLRVLEDVLTADVRVLDYLVAARVRRAIRQRRRLDLKGAGGSVRRWTDPELHRLRLVLTHERNRLLGRRRGPPCRQLELHHARGRAPGALITATRNVALRLLPAYAMTER